MERGRLAKLTERQRDCLRLVYQHQTSKDIARALGISPHTVDERIKAAMQLLGASSRVEAARLLAEHEASTAPQPLGSQPSEVPVQRSGTDTSLHQGEWQNSQSSGRKLMEEQASYVPAPPSPPPRLRLLLSEMRGVLDDLGIWGRIGCIIAIALIVVFAFGIFLAGLEALGKLGWSATQRQS